MTLGTRKSGRSRYYTCSTKGGQEEAGDLASTARKRMRTDGGRYRRDHLRASPNASNSIRKNSASRVEKRASARARRRFRRKNGRFWRAQFCTEVARPERFERPTLRFVV